MMSEVRCVSGPGIPGASEPVSITGEQISEAHSSLLQY
jgi:hypothetical protein